MAPSAAQRNPGGEQRRNHRAQADAGLIDRVAKRPLAGAQVLVNRLSGRRNAGGFGRPSTARQPVSPPSPLVRPVAMPAQDHNPTAKLIARFSPIRSINNPANGALAA